LYVINLGIIFCWQMALFFNLCDFFVCLFFVLIFIFAEKSQKLMLSYSKSFRSFRNKTENFYNQARKKLNTSFRGNPRCSKVKWTLFYTSLFTTNHWQLTHIHKSIEATLTKGSFVWLFILNQPILASFINPRIIHEGFSYGGSTNKFP
jgi:hypothetical protein